MDEFDTIIAETMTAEANDLLDKQLARVTEWKRTLEATGHSATLHDLIKVTMAERSTRHHVIVAYSAALMRLMEAK